MLSKKIISIMIGLNLKNKFRTPKGFYFGSVNQTHVPKINSLWAQKSSRSFEFLSTLINENPSTGLFSNENGELAAWCLMLETGGMGNLQVDEKYYRKGFGEATYMKQALKLGKELGIELHGHIAHQNSISLKMSTKVGFEWIDSNSWIGVRQKEKLKFIPLWSRL
jgi:GNAT superfamily N-acetyltransferase